jgi:uncharacterized lipoprotein YajG
MRSTTKIASRKFFLSLVILLISSLTFVAADEKAGQAVTNAPPAAPPNQGAGPADVQAAMSLPDGTDKRTALTAAVTAWAQVQSRRCRELGGENSR